MGDVLLELPELFEPYTDYVVNFATATAVLAERMENPALAAVIEGLRSERKVGWFGWAGVHDNDSGIGVDLCSAN